MTEPELHPFRVLTEEEEEGPAAEPAGVVDELFAIQVRETRERLKMSQGELARQMSTRGFPYFQQTVAPDRGQSAQGQRRGSEGPRGDPRHHHRPAHRRAAEETGYREPTTSALPVLPADSSTTGHRQAWSSRACASATAPARGSCTASATSWC